MTSLARPRIYWDSCVWIDAIRQAHGQWEHIKPVLDSAKAGSLFIVASQVVRAEVLMCDDIDRETIRRSLLNDYVSLRNVDSRIADRAANLRRDHGLRLADAIHVATALDTLCPYVLTRDGTQGSKKKMLSVDKKLGAPPMRLMTPADYQSLVFGASAPLFGGTT